MFENTINQKPNILLYYYHIIMCECIFLGVYVPACDAEGYYEHTQCHSSVGMCWCVDKHGVEVPNSRVRGKPNCCKCTIITHTSYLNNLIQ